MKTYHLEHLGDLDGLVLRTQNEPKPCPHEVLVQIRATSLNRRDLMILNRTYPLPSRPNIIPLSDGVGEVVAIGSEVSRVALGDRVAGNYFAYWKEGNLNWDLMIQQLGCTLDGMLTEYALMHEQTLVHIPHHLSWEAAAIGKRSMIEIHPPVLAASLLTIRRFLVGNRTAFEDMLRTIDTSKLHPVIDNTFAFSEARQAYQYYATGNIFGKVVITGA